MQLVRKFYASLTLKPQGLTMIVAGFLPVFAIIAMFPVVAAMIGHFKDVPDAAIRVPAMVTAPGYAIAVLAPFAGLFVDRFGRRPLLLACTFFYGIVGTAPFFLENLDVIFASRLLLGVCEAGILTIVNTLIADYWEDRERRTWLMLQGMVGPLFQSLVFLLVAAVAAWRWNGSFLVYLVALPIFAAMYAFIYEPRQPEPAALATPGTVTPPTQAERFPLGMAFLVGGLTLFSSVLYYVFIVNGSIAWAEMGVTDPMAVSKATFIPSFFILAGAVVFRIVSRFSNAAQIATFLLLFGLGLAGIGLAHSVLQMQVALVIQQTGAGMAVPALIAWAQSKFSFRHRGRGMGVWTSCFFLGQAVSPVLVGLVARHLGSMQGAFLAAGVIALAAALAGGAIALRHKAVLAPA
ncbi:MULTISPECIES: MFS transporter [unclassified Novosphingobium]|uniref:MFS transporter n=1 Tax=unclassified Novosphingobium TaxID=2644732 RepID=UPI00146C14A8|nr:MULTISPECIES: MFS transporter [unclassified Novosphingobium]NMN04931.1 MFS family permease [Novosphingobium sp. SG919]NMN87224.1 MFS family permease [Novosphingobium sp. SG916]